MAKKKITFLGTGAADAIEYYHSCFYIHDKNTNLLVDTGGGNGILSQLKKANINIQKIRHLFITHKHIDHILGIFWILRVLGSKIAKNKADNLTIHASKNVIKIINNISSIFLKNKVLNLFDKKILFIPIDNEKEINLGNWKLKPFNLQSKKVEQFGFRVEFEDKKSLVCLGDESYINSLHKLCSNPDYFVHNAYCLEADKKRFNPSSMNHSTVKDACNAAIDVDTKNLILIHTEEKSTLGKRKIVYTKEAKKYFKGNTIVPDDLEIISI